MTHKIAYLKAYLFLFGLLNIAVVPTVPVIFGDIFLWQPRNFATEVMMASLYFSMGLIMLASARQPERHKAFVDFVILGNTLHALVMAILAQTPLHLLLDVIPVGAMGLLPLLFYPWGIRNFLVRTGERPRSNI